MNEFKTTGLQLTQVTSADTITPALLSINADGIVQTVQTVPSQQSVEVVINEIVNHPQQVITVYTYSPAPIPVTITKTYTHYYPEPIYVYVPRNTEPHYPPKELMQRPIMCRRLYWNPIAEKCGPEIYNEAEYLAKQQAQKERQEYINAGLAKDEPPAPSTGGIMVMNREQKQAYQAHVNCGRSGRPMKPFQF